MRIWGALALRGRLGRSVSTGAIAASAALFPVAASADPAGDTASDANRNAGASDIIVSAPRASLYEVADVNVGALGAKNPKDLPLSVESYTSALINAQGARTLLDVVKNDPSVQDNAVGGAFDNISIRGFPVDFTNTMRRDGLALAPYYDVPLENIARIDVLKGPSGFLYGVNSPGGTVNYVLKRPTAEQFTSLTAQFRTHGGYYGAIDSGGPLSSDGSLGYRVNVAGEKVGDFTHAGDLGKLFASAAIDWKPTERLLIRLDGDYQWRSLAAQPVVGPQPDGSLPPYFNPRNLLGQPWLRYRTETFNLGVRVDYELSDSWKFTTQTAFSRNVRDAAFPDVYSVDASGKILSGDIYLSPDQTYRVWSTNSFLSGEVRTGPLNHHIVIGGSTRQYDSREGGFAVLKNSAGQDITVGNIFTPVYTPEPAYTAPTKNQRDNRQLSLFVSDVIDIGEHLSAILGYRWVDYRDIVTPAKGARSRYQTDVSVPSVGLVYKITPHVSLYGNYSEGFEQGGVAPYNTVNAGQYLNPLRSKQYEAGTKAEVLGVSLAAAAFQIDRTLQYVDSANVYVQAGKERHRGVELTANGRITPDLALIAGVAHLNAKQIDTGDAATEGKRPANVPRWQANMFVEYTTPLPGFSVNAGVYYQGERALDPVNTVFLPGYARVDLGARYATEVAGRPVAVRLTVENVGNKHYWAAANYASVYPGRSREAFLRIQTSF